jgi:hypothetical protein
MTLDHRKCSEDFPNNEPQELNARSDSIMTPQSTKSCKTSDEPAVLFDNIASRIETHVSEQIRSLESRFLLNMTGDITRLADEVSSLREAFRDLHAFMRSRRHDSCNPPQLPSSSENISGIEPSVSDDDVVITVAGGRQKTPAAARGKAILSRFSARPPATIQSNGTGGTGVHRDGYCGAGAESEPHRQPPRRLPLRRPARRHDRPQRRHE